MPKPRQRTQLTVQIPDPALLTRLRALADERRQTLTTVVVEALEALLTAPTAGPADDDTLLQRVEALEREVQALKRRPAGVPVVTVPGTSAAPLQPSAQPLERDLPEGAIPTVEVARITGTAATGWNRWAAGHRPGDVWEHPRFGPWRLLGKLPAENGGMPRWMWESAATAPAQS